MKQALIVGAGLSGAAAARLLAEAGFSILILEKRNHIAGNIYDGYEDGVLIHKYGPHLFHTSLPGTAAFLERFSMFLPYEHRVLGKINGCLVPIPFNFKSIDLLYPEREAEHLKALLLKAYPEGSDIPIMELRQHGEEQVRKLAEFVFQKVFLGYTTKQWGMPPENVDASVMGRVPVRMSYDDRYFKDPFQKVPEKGYTHMVCNMLDHPKIRLRLECEAFNHIRLEDGKIYMDGEEWTGPVIYTGCIEQLFGYEFGRLPYRSLAFSLERHNIEQYQPVVQVNYPNQFTYTRTSEFKLLQKDAPKTHTIISYEYPKPCGEDDIPYYPIAARENDILYEQYKKKAENFESLYLLGRLAEYKYYNMDQAVDKAAALSKQIIDRFY